MPTVKTQGQDSVLSPSSLTFLQEAERGAAGLDAVAPSLAVGACERLRCHGTGSQAGQAAGGAVHNHARQLHKRAPLTGSTPPCEAAERSQREA